MFEPYNKNVYTEVDGRMRIIGDKESGMCLLKDQNGPIYVGPFIDCEYVASLCTESDHKRNIELFLNNLWSPCREHDAVRGVTYHAGNYHPYVKYQAPIKQNYNFKGALRLLLRDYSPFDIRTFDKDGWEASENYRHLVIVDRRNSRGVCITFKHGIRIAASGTFADSYRAVGGDCGSKYAGQEYDNFKPGDWDMSQDKKWAWDTVGRPPKNLFDLIAKDPDVIASQVHIYSEKSVHIFGAAKEILDKIKESREPEVMYHIFRQRSFDVYTLNGLKMPQALIAAFDAIWAEYMKGSGLPCTPS